MHALQCLRDPRRPTGRDQPGRDPPRTTRAHKLSLPLLTHPARPAVLFTAHSRIGPDEAARTPACSACGPSMLPHAPHISPVHAHAVAPSPRRYWCQTVPVKVHTSVSWQAAEARIGLSSRHRGGVTPSEPPLRCPEGTPRGADTTRPPRTDGSVDGSRISPSHAPFKCCHEPTGSRSTHTNTPHARR